MLPRVLWCLIVTCSHEKGHDLGLQLGHPGAHVAATFTPPEWAVAAGTVRRPLVFVAFHDDQSLSLQVAMQVEAQLRARYGIANVAVCRAERPRGPITLRVVGRPKDDTPDACAGVPLEELASSLAGDVAGYEAEQLGDGRFRITYPGSLSAATAALVLHSLHLRVVEIDGQPYELSLQVQADDGEERGSMKAQQGGVTQGRSQGLRNGGGR